MNMIEKVARAICWRQHGWDAAKSYDVWDDIGNGDRSGYMDDARTAIEALREPTGRMIDAVADEERKRGYFASETLECYDAWPIMIAAALSEPVTSPTSSDVSA